jgi:uncharacterized membrane protein YccC
LNRTLNSIFAGRNASWLLALTFIGLMVGFVLLILTLSWVNSAVLSGLGAFFVWTAAKRGHVQSFATQAIAVYLVSAGVGIAVGWATTIGTGLPVSLFFLREALTYL